jgi:hypothetical protein
MRMANNVSKIAMGRRGSPGQYKAWLAKRCLLGQAKAKAKRPQHA